MQEERAHRKWSPSQAERIFFCPGSSNLIARVPKRPSSVYAIEGTNAHDVLEAALRNGCRDAKEAHFEYSNLWAQELDDGNNEFYLSVQTALNYVYGLLDEYPDAQWWIETFVDPPLPSDPGEAGGFCDVGIWVPSIRTLFVIDYKHGAGVAKAARGNHQVFQYGAGFLYDADPLVSPDDVDTVVLTIVQPRAFHEEGPIREVEVTPTDLWNYLLSLDVAVRNAQKPDAPLVPGEDQCRFCDANTSCPARETQALQVAQAGFSQIKDVAASALPPPSQLDINRLAQIRFHAPMLRKWLEDIDKHCEELMRGGHHVPGAKLVMAQARRKYWGSEEDTAKRIAALAGASLDDVWTRKLMNITTAEKMVVEAYKRRVGRGKKNAAAADARQAFAFLTIKETSGNLVVADEDDPRPAVNKAASAFGNLIGVIE